MEKRLPLRILLAKVGLDGHDRGIKLVARALRDAGMEVIYTGLRSTPEGVVRTAVQEDVSLLGLSFLAGDHMVLIPKVLEGLRREGLGDVPVVVGGVILKSDIAALKAMGVAEIFVPGTPLDKVVQFIGNSARRAQAEERFT